MIPELSLKPGPCASVGRCPAGGSGFDCGLAERIEPSGRSSCRSHGLFTAKETTWKPTKFNSSVVITSLPPRVKRRREASDAQIPPATAAVARITSRVMPRGACTASPTAAPNNAPMEIWPS